MHNIQAITLGLGLGAVSLITAAPVGHVLIYRPPYLHGILLNHTSPNGTTLTTQHNRNHTSHHQQPKNVYVEIDPSFDHLKNSTFVPVDHKSRDERSIDPSNTNLNSQKLDAGIEKVIEARRDPGATWLCNFAAKIEPFWSEATGQGKHPVNTNRCLDSRQMHVTTHDGVKPWNDPENLEKVVSWWESIVAADPSMNTMKSPNLNSRQPHNGAKNEAMVNLISEERSVETQNFGDQIQQARNEKTSYQLESRGHGFADWMKKHWPFASKRNRAVENMDKTSQQLDQRNFQSWWNKNWRDW